MLIALRLTQGIAVGGEWGGAALMTAEHAPPARRGWITAMAMGAMALVALLPSERLLSWGWRIPFLVSFALLMIALYMRVRISESRTGEHHASHRVGGSILASPSDDLAQITHENVQLGVDSNYLMIVRQLTAAALAMRRPMRLAPQPAAGAQLARRSQVHAEVTREAASTIHSEQDGVRRSCLWMRVRICARTEPRRTPAYPD